MIVKIMLKGRRGGQQNATKHKVLRWDVVLEVVGDIIEDGERCS